MQEPKEVYREKFPKGPDWREPDPNPFGSEQRISTDSYHGMEAIGYSKERVTGYNKEDVLSDKLIVVRVRDMSREELEKFADRMRIDRNSFLLQLDELDTLKQKVEELQTELYFCYRNNKIEEIVDGKEIQKEKQT